MKFKREAVLLRYWQDGKQTTGSLIVKSKDLKGQPVFIKPAIERGWKDNQNMISCVPEGSYAIFLEHSPRFKQELWELKGVPNRSECKIHAVNFARDLNGCVAPGDDLADMDKDGYIDVTNSRATMKQFHKAMGDLRESVIHIVDLIL